MYISIGMFVLMACLSVAGSALLAAIMPFTLGLVAFPITRGYFKNNLRGYFKFAFVLPISALIIAFSGNFLQSIEDDVQDINAQNEAYYNMLNTPEEVQAQKEAKAVQVSIRRLLEKIFITFAVIMIFLARSFYFSSLIVSGSGDNFASIGAPLAVAASGGGMLLSGSKMMSQKGIAGSKKLYQGARSGYSKFKKG